MKVSTATTIALIAMTATVNIRACHGGTLTIANTQHRLAFVDFSIESNGPGPNHATVHCADCTSVSPSPHGCTNRAPETFSVYSTDGGESEVRRGRDGFEVITKPKRADLPTTVIGYMTCSTNADVAWRNKQTVRVVQQRGHWSNYIFNGDLTDAVAAPAIDWASPTALKPDYDNTGHLKLDYADTLTLQRGETTRVVYNVTGTATGTVVFDTSSLPGFDCGDPDGWYDGTIAAGQEIVCENYGSPTGVVAGALTITIGLK